MTPHKLNVRHPARPALLTTGMSMLLGVCGPVYGQEDPIVINPRRELPLLEFDNVHASLGLEYRWQEDTSDTTGQPTTTETEQEFRELFEVSTDGFIRHPNLVHLSLFGSMILEQNDFDSDTPSGDRQVGETLQEYDARATILRRSNTPLTVFTRQFQTLLDRQFGPTIESTDTASGFNWLVTLPQARHSFSYTQRKTSQNDPSTSGNNSFDQIEDLVDISSQINLGEYQDLDFNYRLNKIDLTAPVRADIHYTRHDTDLTHTVDFGNDHQSNIRSRFEFFDQQGDFAEERFRWDEIVRLTHSPTLESRYHFTALDQQRAGLTQRAYNGDALVRHRLYDSLVTTAQVGGHAEDFSDGFKTDGKFGDLALEYTKLVPRGRLSGDLRLRYDQQDNGERGQPFQVVREPHAFVGPSPVILARSNIDAASIVVHNIANPVGPAVYSEGIDYRVTVLANRIELRRVLTGRITAGENVEIDYTVDPEPAHNVTSNTVGLGLRYDLQEGPLSGLGVFMRYLSIDESIRSDRLIVVVPNNVEELAVGVEYRLGVLIFEAEHIDHDSDISPFEQTRFEVILHDRISSTDSLDIRVQHTETEFIDEDNTATQFTASGTFTHEFSRKLNGRIELLWFDLSEDIGEDSTSFEQRFDLDWRYRQTSAFLQIRNEVFSSNSSDTTSQSLFAGVRRNF